MKKQVEKPKVFISYAWSGKEYENMVLAFASKLMSDGINVVIDKWDLSEGNDTYAYMEKCVNDETITNVLILLDPTYAEKANKNIGGVGTETQIISSKVYKQVDQNKFIPIVMKRNEDGSVSKPTYLQGRLHFDLTNENEYDLNYKKLVKFLYGEEYYEKPELGTKPTWVNEKISIDPKIINSYENLENKDISKKEIDNKFCNYLSNISTLICEKGKMINDKQLQLNELLNCYSKNNIIRKQYLLLLNKSVAIENSYKSIASFFEETVSNIKKKQKNNVDLLLIFIHELFIYTIAYYLRIKDYKSIGYIFSKTYFDIEYNRVDPNSYNMFYAGRYFTNFDSAMKTRDNNNYYCGVAEYWLSNIDIDFCSKENFIMADLVCFNYSIYGNDYDSNWGWFPVTYVYGKNELSIFSKKLVSRENATDVINLFCFNTIDEFKNKLKEVEAKKEEIGSYYRYQMTFNRAPLISDYINSKDFGILK